MGIRGFKAAGVVLGTLLLTAGCTASSGAPLGQDNHDVATKPTAGSAAPKNTVASGPGSVYTPETSSAGSGGTDWTLMTPAPAQQPKSILWGVAAVDANHAWAVGSQFADRKAPEPLIERWDGTSWTSETIQGLAHPETAGMHLVAADAVNDVWAVSTYSENGVDKEINRVFHDDGTGWREVPFPPGAAPTFLQINGIAVVAGHVFLDGWQNQRPYFQEWDGGAWHELAPPIECTSGGTSFGGMPNSCSVNGITAFAPDDVWVAGNGDWDNFQGPVLFHWDGKAWHTVKVIGQPKSTQFLDLVFGKSSNDLWAIGAMEGVGDTLAVHWDGKAFTTLPWTYTGAVYGAAIAPGDVPYVVTGFNAEGRVHILRWDGKAWQKMPLPLPSGDYFGDYAGIAAVPGTPTLLVVGQGRTGNDPASAIYTQSVLRYDTPPPPVLLSPGATSTG